MSKLKDIVPPLELCKMIPKGEFADSTLVWSLVGTHYCEDGMFDEIGVITRSRGRQTNIQFPAPTLAEILDELPTVWNNRFLVMLDVTNKGKGHQIGYARLIDGVLDSDGDFCIQDLNPAIAALWLWFRVKGALC